MEEVWDGLADAVVVSLVARAIHADEDQREKRAMRAVVSFPRLAIQLPGDFEPGASAVKVPEPPSPPPLHCFAVGIAGGVCARMVAGFPQRVLLACRSTNEAERS